MLIFMESNQPQLQGKQNQSKSMIGSHPVFPDKFSQKKKTHILHKLLVFKHILAIQVIQYN